MGELLTWFDDASIIVAHNGASFDLAVLTEHYRGDDARQQRHRDKLLDTMQVARAVTGHRVSLQRLLHLNACGSKQGKGAEAPSMWQSNRLAQLQQYCEGDVRGLEALVVRARVLVAARTVTREMSLRDALTKKSDTRREQACANGAAAAAADDDGNPPGARRPRRKRKEVGNYDETERRTRKRTGGGYMVRNTQRHGQQRKDRVVMGEACIDKIVAGAYEWRDAGLRPKRRRDPGKQDEGRPPGRPRHTH